MRRKLAWVLVLALLGQGCVGLVGDDEAASSRGSTGSMGTDGDDEAPNGTGFTTTHVLPGNYTTSGPFAETAEEGDHEIGEPTVTALTSDVDGEEIQLLVVRPVDAEGPLPVVAHATPRTYGSLEGYDPHEHVPHLVENLVPHGFALAVIASRGAGDSGGCNAFLGPKEISDVDQAVSWLGEQEWTNGHVGMIGLSYSSGTAWGVAARGNSHLETVVTAGSITDLFDVFYRNGTTQVRGFGYLHAAFNSFGYRTTPIQGRSAEHVVDAAVCPEMLEGLAASAHAMITGKPGPTGHWEERNFQPGVLANYTGSVLFAQGLRDWNVRPSLVYPFSEQLEDQGTPVKLVLGQWRHAWPDSSPFGPHDNARWDWAQILLHWMDHWLKPGVERDLGPRVQVQDTEGGWRSAQDWPPPEAGPLRLEATPEGRLARNGSQATARHPITADPGRMVSHEPVLQERCPGCASFTTSPMDHRLRFAGTPTASLEVTPSAPDGVLTAYLYATGEDDRRLLAVGQTDVRAADGDLDPATPGQRTSLRLTFEPADALVPEGYQLELVLSQGTYGSPPYATSKQYLPWGPPAPIVLHTGDNATTLSLDTFEVDASRSFVPPGGPHPGPADPSSRLPEEPPNRDARSGLRELRNPSR